MFAGLIRGSLTRHEEVVAEITGFLIKKMGILALPFPEKID
jgi:hypothetical protein